MTEYAIKIRRAKAGDLEKIAEVYTYAEGIAAWEETGKHNITPEKLKKNFQEMRGQFNEHAKPPHACAGIWVAEHKGRIAGFIAIERYTLRKAGIDKLYVDPAYWGSNIATDLFRRAEYVFRRNKIKHGVLSTPSYPRVHAFYKKMGWHQPDWSEGDDYERHFG